jgi:23S rRNA (pseudouridine1915-N3)-methyltransferase
MHIRLLAVGDRQPSWVDTAFDTYVARLPRQWQFRVEVIPTAARQKKSVSDTAKAAEGKKVLAKIKAPERVVVLDEGGRQFSSREFATSLQDWLADGPDLVFVIGGPDGISNECMQRADSCWSLSKLTLPHGLARVLFAEQLYRAWSLAAGHPYHRN